MTAQGLKTLRREAGLTQAQLAARIGVARNTVTRWEMGLHPISQPIALLIDLLSPASPSLPSRPSRRR